MSKTTYVPSHSLYQTMHQAPLYQEVTLLLQRETIERCQRHYVASTNIYIKYEEEKGKKKTSIKGNAVKRLHGQNRKN